MKENSEEELSEIERDLEIIMNDDFDELERIIGELKDLLAMEK